MSKKVSSKPNAGGGETLTVTLEFLLAQARQSAVVVARANEAETPAETAPKPESAPKAETERRAKGRPKAPMHYRSADVQRLRKMNPKRYAELMVVLSGGALC